MDVLKNESKSGITSILLPLAFGAFSCILYFAIFSVLLLLLLLF